MQTQPEEYPDFTVYTDELIRLNLLLYSLKLKGTTENLSFSKVITVALVLTHLMLMCLLWRRENNDDDSNNNSSNNNNKNNNKGLICWRHTQ